jgi:glutathione synthase/RimK-type ligase-like ATP-grasp enzyme
MRRHMRECSAPRAGAQAWRDISTIDAMMNGTGDRTLVALATSPALPNLVPDDAPLLAALERHGVDFHIVTWDADVDWRRYDAVLLRTCWDYHLRFAAFYEWVRGLERDGVPVWNGADVVRWNSHKRYLFELEAAGVGIVPGVLLAGGTRVDAAALLGAHGWSKVVVKPAISASAHRTTIEAGVSVQPALDALLADGDAIVQPYIENVTCDGEWSLLFIENRFSHAIVKRPRPGDFRVQEEWGGSTERVVPPEWLVQQAAAAVRACGFDLLYARVDGFAIDGRLLVGELELIEPQLYLLFGEETADQLAAAVARRTRAARRLVG